MWSNLGIWRKFFVVCADDTTPYVIGKNNEKGITEVINITKKLFTWFSDNQMKAIHGKCHLLLSTSKPLSIQVDRTLIKVYNSKSL